MLYKVYRNKLNGLLRRAERKHYQLLLQKDQNNLKQSWKIINEVINKKKNSLNSKEFLINNETVTDKKAIADSFNQYFINLASSLSENTPNSQLDPIKYTKNSPQKSLFLTDITRSELKIIISLLTLPATSILVVGGVFKVATTSILVVVIIIFLNILKCTDWMDNRICQCTGNI